VVDQLVVRYVRGVVSSYVFAVAQDCHAVADHEQFLEFMRDEHDADVSRPEHADYFKKRLDFPF
jgi:hypothetical protein